MNKEIIDTLKGVDGEGSASPYWLILDPKQNMNCDIYGLANQITGVFFSRSDAEEYLLRRSYAFSDRARVFCHSGHHSQKYHNLCKELRVGY